MRLPRLLLTLALAGVASACRTAPPAPEIPVVTVGGLDYTFDLPTGLSAGPVEIAFENRGQVPHEVVLVELAPGTTVADMGAIMESGGDPGEMIRAIGGVLIADPGQSAWGRLKVELEAGRTYALVCNFVDAEGDPPHIALGMVRTFSVD